MAFDDKAAFDRSDFAEPFCRSLRMGRDQENSDSVEENSDSVEGDSDSDLVEDCDSVEHVNYMEIAHQLSKVAEGEIQNRRLIHLAEWDQSKAISRLYTSLEVEARRYGLSFFQLLAKRAWSSDSLLRAVLDILFKQQAGSEGETISKREMKRLMSLRKEVVNNLKKLDGEEG